MIIIIMLLGISITNYFAVYANSTIVNNIELGIENKIAKSLSSIDPPEERLEKPTKTKIPFTMSYKIGNKFIWQTKTAS